MELKNPETGKTGKDLGKYIKERKLRVMDVVVRTGISAAYISAMIKHNKPIKKNMYERLKGKDSFPGLEGF